MDGHEGINQVKHIVIGRQHTFILFEPSYGDLHSHVRTKRRLRESEAIGLFQQILQIHYIYLLTNICVWQSKRKGRYLDKNDKSFLENKYFANKFYF